MTYTRKNSSHTQSLYIFFIFICLYCLKLDAVESEDGIIIIIKFHFTLKFPFSKTAWIFLNCYKIFKANNLCKVIIVLLSSVSFFVYVYVFV